MLRGFRSGQLSPVEVVRHALDEISSYDEAIRAFSRVDADEALDAARASEDRWRRSSPAGPLDGVPVGVKDVEADSRNPPRFGFQAEAGGSPPQEDSPSVRALRKSGAVIVGRTATPQVGWKATTTSPDFPPTRNPHDLSRTAGGSSGGSGAAVAAGFVPLAVGTDGGGSIRIPASFCGIVGFKPTFARVAQWPPSTVGLLAHTGPMAGTVQDAALMFEVLASGDIREWASPSAAPDRAVPAIQDLRIAYSADLGYVSPVHEEVAAAVEAAVQEFAEMGAKVVEVHPGFRDPAAAFQTLWDASFAFTFERLADEWQAEAEPGLRAVVERGRSRSALDLMRAEYERAELTVQMARFHTEWDILVTPTMPIPAFGAERDLPESGVYRDWPSWTPFTWPFNMTQQPAISVPCGATSDGLPIGMQLIGARHSDYVVLSTAAAYESHVAGAGPRQSRVSAGQE